jgi:hypothetical protein
MGIKLGNVTIASIIDKKTGKVLFTQEVKLSDMDVYAKGGKKDDKIIQNQE